MHNVCEAGLIGHDLGKVFVRLRRLIADARICITHDAPHRLRKVLLQQQAGHPACCLTHPGRALASHNDLNRPALCLWLGCDSRAAPALPAVVM